MDTPLSQSSSPLLKPSSSSDHHSDSDTTEKTLLEAPQVTSRRRRPFTLLLHIATSLLALYGLFTLLGPLFAAHKPPSQTTPDVYRPWTLPPALTPNCTCGPTLHAARALNCTYDPLAAAWLPPHCRDEALTLEFTQSGPGPNGTWTYYADANGTVPVSAAEIAAMGPEGKFWVERGWHLAHCVFYWEKYMRMRMTGRVMEGRFDNVPHVRHCGRLLRKERPAGRVLVEVDVVMDSRLDLGGHKHEHESKEG